MERRGVEKGAGREGKREGGEYFEIEGRVSRNEGYGVGEKDEMIKRVNVWGRERDGEGREWGRGG